MTDCTRCGTSTDGLALTTDAVFAEQSKNGVVWLCDSCKKSFDNFLQDPSETSLNPSDFVEGGLYSLEALPESDMTKSGALEAIGDGRLGALYGDCYVTFEYHTVRCTDVKNVGDSDD